MDKKVIIAVLATICLTATLFIAIPTMSSPGLEYDHWYDINDDGSLDMADISLLIDNFMASGTAINKTALLLELQERLDALNASILLLENDVDSLQDSYDALKLRVTALEGDVASLQDGLSDLQSQLTSLETYVDGVVIGFTNDIVALEMGLIMVNGLIIDLTTQMTSLEGRVNALEVSVASLITDLDGTKFGKAFSAMEDINPIVTTYSGYLWWDFSEKALKATETNSYNGYWHLGGIRNQGTPALYNTWIDDGETETVATLNANGHWVTFDFTSEGPNAGYIRIHAYYANGRFTAHYSYRYQ